MAKFKYKINEQISLLPRGYSIDNLIKLLHEKHGITRNEFYGDRNITLTSEKSIPSDRLDAYAVVFGCTADSLKNYEVKGKSIHDILGSSKKIKHGLV